MLALPETFVVRLTHKTSYIQKDESKLALLNCFSLSFIMPPMRIAIAGTCGLAQLIAHTLSTHSLHTFIILSRNVSLVAESSIALTKQANPAMAAKGWQVLQVNYANATDLRYKLAGVDTVISTVNGDAQLALIDAAAAAQVRRFVPSEFEGSPTSRPANDIFDSGRRAALSRLHHYESYGMRYAVFTCGVMYERFCPGGSRSYQIGMRSAISAEGQYILDIRNCKAMIPHRSSTSDSVYLCLTSARDVARFVVAALSLTSWPREFRMRGERMSINQLVSVAEAFRGNLIHTTLSCWC